MEISEEQQQILELMKQARKRDCLGQAYLLIGDDSEFLRNYAREWMKISACLHLADDGSPCGICQICQSIDNDKYEDCYSVSPLSKTRIITIDAMRQFDHMLGLAARPGHLKFGVIYDAECMGEDAQNSFLKTLEEPPSNTMLLLLTSNPRKLLPTIRSRCQIVSLMRNRRNYSVQAERGLFEVLSKVHRRAGIKVALDALDAIKKIFSGLASDAEEYVETNWDPSWDSVEEGNNELKKQLEELKQKKIDTEYCRLREMYLDAIQVWFLQRYLIALGISKTELPQPDLLKYADDSSEAIDELEAEEDLSWCDEMLRCLKANVNESVALLAFLLQVCEK